MPTTTDSQKVFPWKEAVALAGTAVAAAFIVLLILRYAVAIPMLDDWEMVPLVMKAHTGGLTFADLFAQQQEARTFFPKLIFIALSFAKYWDARAAMMLSVLICCLTALGLYRLIARAKLPEVVATIAFVLCVLLIFSPAQHELWLLASGFPSFVPALCMVWGICVATGRRGIASRFWICVALAVGASFTLSNGLLAWGLTFPLLLAIEPERTGKRWLLSWCAAAAVCAALYFWNFQFQPDLPGFAPRKSLIEYWQYVAAFLGGAFGRAGNEHPLAISVTIGTGLLLGYLAALVDAITRRRDPIHRARVVPWLGLGGYSIGSAVLAALGRIEWGVSQALESRYVAYSISLSIALIVLGAIYWTEFRMRAPSRLRFASFAVALLLVAGCFTFGLLCAADSVSFFRIRSAAARLGQSAVLFSAALDTSKTTGAVNFPRPDFVRKNAEALDRLGLLRTRLVRTRALAELRHAGAEDGGAAGWWDGLTTGSDGINVAWGWAALPARNRPADAVILAYANEKGEWIAFAISDAVLSRPDVARALGSADQLWSGWRARFAADALPKGAEISAWAINAREPKLYRLKTTAPILTP